MDSIKLGIFNNKGGVAKTTSVINLAYSLQTYDKRVLVVDCDTQENCFTFFMAHKSKAAILPTEYEKINHTTWERYKQLSSEPEGYDYIIFDMPPTLSDEVREILRQCSAVYVPTILGEFEIAGLRKVTDEINAQGVRLGGVFVTMYQAQNDAELIEDFRKPSDENDHTVLKDSKRESESRDADRSLLQRSRSTKDKEQLEDRQCL